MENQQNVNRQRFYSIDIIKLICACLVVGIHAQFFYEICKPFGEILSSSLGRMAVPFFSCVSGYFFICAEKGGKKVLIHQIRSLLRYYVNFSLIYIIWDFVCGNFAGLSILQLFYTIGKRVLLYGTYYHLWFFPCIIYTLIIIHMVQKWCMNRVLILISLFTYIFAAFTYGWNQIGQLWIPGFTQLMQWFDFDYIRRFAGVTLPFAVLGFIIIKTCEFWIGEGKDRYLWTAWGISLILYILEVALVLKTGIADGTTVTFTLMPAIYFTFMLGLRYPMKSKRQIAVFSRRTSIVLYGLHPFILECMKKLFHACISQTFSWVLSILICILISIFGSQLLKEGRHEIKKRSTF